MRDACVCGYTAIGAPMKKHDAYWCPKCDLWLEKACSDETCEFCVGRPERPSMVG